MFHQTCFTDWHQILLLAAGFLIAILSVWHQSEQRFFYEERKKYEGFQLKNLHHSSTLAGIWLSAGIAFALLAFGLTVIDWMLPYPCVAKICSVTWKIPTKQLATGFLVGAFNVTLLAVMKTIIRDLGKTAWTKKEELEEPLDYGTTPVERWHNRIFLSVAITLALTSIFVFSVVLLPRIPPNYFCFLMLCSFGIPLFIVGCTYLLVQGCDRDIKGFDLKIKDWHLKIEDWHLKIKGWHLRIFRTER